MSSMLTAGLGWLTETLADGKHILALLQARREAPRHQPVRISITLLIGMMRV